MTGIMRVRRQTDLAKVALVSLGCPKNLVDSEVMMGILAREGYELTPHADDAEIVWIKHTNYYRRQYQTKPASCCQPIHFTQWSRAFPNIKRVVF